MKLNGTVFLRFLVEGFHISDIERVTVTNTI
jgi:hypothetical protein